MTSNQLPILPLSLSHLHPATFEHRPQNVNVEIRIENGNGNRNGHGHGHGNGHGNDNGHGHGHGHSNRNGNGNGNGIRSNLSHPTPLTSNSLLSSKTHSFPTSLHSDQQNLLDNILPSQQHFPTTTTSSTTSFLDSRPTSSNGHQSRLIESSPDSSLGSNAPPPYYPSYPSHQPQTAGYPNLHPPLHSPDTRTQLFVGNLPFRVRWQDLKDLFRKAGTVLRADVSLTIDNRSKGFGTVLFANRYDALKAIEIYNGFSWQTRTLDVRLDQQDPIGALAMSSVSAALPNSAHRLGPSGPTTVAPRQPFHSNLLNPGRPPPPSSSWPPGFCALAPSATINKPATEQLTTLDGLVQSTPALSLNSSAPDHALSTPSPAPSTLTKSSSFGIRLAHQQHQSTQSLTCADLIRSSSARLSDGSTNRLSSSLSHPSPRRASAVASHPQPVLDAMRPAFRPLALSLDNSAGPSGLMKELEQVPKETEYTSDPTRTEPGKEDVHPALTHPQQHSSNSIPSIVYPYYTTSSTAMSSSGSSGITNCQSTRTSQTGPPINTSNRHLFVGNLPFNCQWQDLKDLFRNAGNILRADVAMGVDGRSRGFGTVLFATADDAQNAVRLYDGHEFNGRLLKVHFDKFTHPSISPGPASTEHSPHHQSASQPSYHSSVHSSDPHRQRMPPHQYNAVTGYSNYFNYGPPSTGVGMDLKRVPSNNSVRFEPSLPSPHEPINPSASFQGGSSAQSTHPHQQHMIGFYSSNPELEPFPIDQNQGQQSSQPNEFQVPGSDLWGPDHVSARSGAQARARDVPSAPPELPLSPIASRRSSFLKPDSPPHDAQPPAVQPIGHPNAGLGLNVTSSTRPNSIPMPPPYDLAAGGLASPPIPRGIQMTPSMPAFSFQPYPATPPLLPNFFSPGIGPSTPPSSSRGRAPVHQPNANRNNIGLYSFNNPDLHLSTSMAGGPSKHSPLGYNPMFPATDQSLHATSADQFGSQAVPIVGSRTEDEHTGLGLYTGSETGLTPANGFAIIHAPSSSDDSKYNGELSPTKPTHEPEPQEISARNRRLGIGVTAQWE
ncbi:hypothetical protein CROQUDRAFT_641281 [Cronartium quercuum f. sp. fusiforme G11]|uniref:RRM domain-containing protein n=1 Tax=Cronartium quercuum f. sp. fusiforme G11 TaxID=708437 RepID=A0A9P6T9I5_9BASI|nr:hypothetical protein CROQUDRAFT_641281 [Cronartium quercuum f. sp. fusiforme G11]